MANQYPPILQVPISKSFRDLDEVQVTLRFDEPKEFEGNYGTQYKYSVDVDGTEHTLFASPALHRQIQEHHPSKGSILSIARVGQKKDTKWDVVYVSGPRNDSPRGPGSPKEGTGGREPARPTGPDPKGFTDELARYWLAFDLAMETLDAKGVTTSVDGNAVAFVIYKMAKDHGIPDPSNPGTAPTPETDTQDAENNGKGKMRVELERLFKETGLDQRDWLEVLNLHRSENQEPVTMWSEVTRDMGLAAFATAKNVEAGATTWSEVLNTEEEITPPF